MVVVTGFLHYATWHIKSTMMFWMQLGLRDKLKLNTSNSTIANSHNVSVKSNILFGNPLQFVM